MNGARRGTQKLLTSPQAMHAAVLAGFPPGVETSNHEGRTLWRLDFGTDRGVTLCIVSPSRPDLTHLVEQAGWPANQGWETRDYAPFLGRLESGQRWVFRLTANPSHSHKDHNGTTRRLGHVSPKWQKKWLLAQGGKNGFVVSPAGDGEYDMILSRRDKKSFRRSDATVTLSTAQYDGQLEIADSDAFTRALRNGIGPAKGYGCGLMTLARVRPSE